MSERDLDQLDMWQFDLPEELIASRPAERRESARLLVVDRNSGSISDHVVSDLPKILAENDILVFNNTRVLPARLFGYRVQTGGRWEGLFLEETADGGWILLCETRGRLQPGETIRVVPADELIQRAEISRPVEESPQPSMSAVPALILSLVTRRNDGSWLAIPAADSPYTLERRGSMSMESVLQLYGSLPLPPYMGRRLADAKDRERYQTTFASEPGAVAAPTAGLHFTPELLAECQRNGIDSTEVTLHVGIGTFRPVKVSRLSEHEMHSEWCRLSDATCAKLRSSRERSGRIVAVGTTCVRTLESAIRETAGDIQPWQGETSIFIRPGFKFQMVDGMLTNFHLPGSTLIVLVAAFAGYDLVMEAYRHAVSRKYRFYSYGDAMLIL
ncbi:MAG: tRNA preQ1(34) S-adenosylmethionine ribosyltransferase-isomerase QueA [Planctomyces sp.]